MNSTYQIRTDFLFSSPDFLTGMGSVLNIFGEYYTFNGSTSEKEADAKALSSDWSNVAQDLSSVLAESEK